ncbi:Beta-1,3-galactosyltransferase 5 [Desmophyllum pertusum]|uniref:Hexosyltransferase n=1 Tax=Desmophyllum pertusum TaxID=174260 RepID=A0A9X0CG54_9CNID|nr:Beta-1,3-galactosyltransferase 5 [Desmophyllum pertusum]
MHGKLKYCLKLLPWKMLVMRTRQLLIIGVIAAALITTLVSGLLIKSYATVAQPHRFVPHHDCKSWKTTSQHKSTLITKTACVQNYFLLILVSSSPANLERRNLIRQTWGADNNAGPQWKTYFLLGQTRNQTLTDSLKIENNNYGDMIRADYYEHYWNQSLKIQMAFEWAARYCNFSFLLKTDDDVLVNTRDLIVYLQRGSTPKQGLLWADFTTILVYVELGSGMSVMKSIIKHTIQISVVVLALLCHMMLSSALFLYLMRLSHIEWTMFMWECLQTDWE